ncbi:NAD dependent epimerase/dehydratase family protein-like protein [Eremomyces bilateralis CBS 781.70]|uniref:NAD dependent epimerase/dehydratase family protein-like protein n=1 Tax=Eremomyces bilateralis CBS 781.70 TaxID=1392243 RepID=A0A6G1GF78_9PEZI|nr:NAD dependent epimerase/dehydratase family protein-like protein [Eremomyces bilateralis CBS 781.70]KAF1816652.1 NAD dependent epimerase/dehydratase family protein-like protein [Eremomyces bilateralis CBS 781.70]
MATAAVKRKIVVCGGNGFLGTRICRAAAQRGWDVTSIGRSGEPSWSAVSSSSTAPKWSKSVTWTAANILQPDSYKEHLKGADAVVHSMGILLEADYKGVIQGKESPIRGLQRAFSATKRGSQNPLTRKEGEVLKPQEEDGQLTYELMNRDSAITLAREAHAANSTTAFVYISATAGAPFLPSRYLSTKRDAEATIAAEFPSMREIFIRPSFMFDSSRSFTLPIAAAGMVGSMVNSAMGRRLSWLIGAGGEKPLRVEAVGDAVVEAIGDEGVRGVVDVAEIDRLATKAWRKGML